MRAASPAGRVEPCIRWSPNLHQGVRDAGKGVVARVGAACWEHQPSERQVCGLRGGDAETMLETLFDPSISLFLAALAMCAAWLDRVLLAFVFCSTHLNVVRRWANSSSHGSNDMSTAALHI